MATEPVEITVVEDDTVPGVRWPVTISGAAKDITAATISGTLYYYETDAEKASWSLALSKVGAGVASYFSFLFGTSTPAMPSGFSGSRTFKGDVFYSDTVTGEKKWFREVLIAHVSQKIEAP